MGGQSIIYTRGESTFTYTSPHHIMSYHVMSYQVVIGSVGGVILVTPATATTASPAAK